MEAANPGPSDDHAGQAPGRGLAPALAGRNVIMSQTGVVASAAAWEQWLLEVRGYRRTWLGLDRRGRRYAGEGRAMLSTGWCL